MEPSLTQEEIALYLDSRALSDIGENRHIGDVDLEEFYELELNVDYILKRVYRKGWPTIQQIIEHLHNKHFETKLSTSEKIDAALRVAMLYGSIDGERHKTWVIDQMCRALLGEKYEDFIANAKSGEDGPDTYEWDVGTPP